MIRFLQALSLLVFLCPFWVRASGPSRTDSLVNLLRSASADTQRVMLRLKIAESLLDSDPDSAFSYASSSYNLAQKLGFANGRIGSANILGNYYQRKGALDKAMDYYNESLGIARERNDLNGQADGHNNIGIIHVNRSQYPAALQSFLKGLEFETRAGNQEGMAESYNNIAVVHYYQGNMGKCAEYLSKANVIIEKLGNRKLLKKGLINLGAIYESTAEYDKAISVYLKALKISEEMDDKKEYSICLQNLANIYTAKKDYTRAFEYFDRAIAVKEKIGDFQGLAVAYANMGLTFERSGQEKKAEELFFRALNISREKGFPDTRKMVYENLATLYKNQGKYSEAYDYHVLYSQAKDSIYNLEKLKTVEELQAKYEALEREKKMAEQQSELAKSELLIKNRNNTIIIVSSIAMLILALGIMVYVQQRTKQRQLRKEAGLKQKLAEAELVNKVQSEKERISRDLHDHIGTQLTLITTSLDNLACRFDGNKELAPHIEDIGSQARDTMAQLRETIWAMNKESISAEMLLSKIREFGQKSSLALGPDKRITTTLQGDGKILLTPSKSLALFRVCQEAVNNALKHADFTEMNIDLLAINGGVTLRIADNGKGFEKEEASTRGYGLENMAFRIEEAGGEFSLTTAPGEGTKIEIS
jgi:signal transduction histidine kinase